MFCCEIEQENFVQQTNVKLFIAHNLGGSNLTQNKLFTETELPDPSELKQLSNRG